MSDQPAPSPLTAARLWRYYLLAASPVAAAAALLYGGVLQRQNAVRLYYRMPAAEIWWIVLVAAALHLVVCGAAVVHYVEREVGFAATAPRLRLLRFSGMYAAVTFGTSLLLLLAALPFACGFLFFSAPLPLGMFFVPYQLLVGPFVGWAINRYHRAL